MLFDFRFPDMSAASFLLFNPQLYELASLHPGLAMRPDDVSESR